MKLVTRLLAILGVAYLAVVSGLYLVQNDRAADVENHQQVITGTVKRVDVVTQNDIRDVFRPRTVTIPVITFTVNGVQHEYRDETARGQYQVGQQVPLLYNANDPADPNDDLVLIKGQDVTALRAISAGFAAAALAAAWVFAVMGVLQLRRRRQRGQRRASTAAAVA